MTTPSVPVSLAVFSLWMLSSFLCHKLAKMALEIYVTDVTSFSPLSTALIVTLCQTLCCYASINMTSWNGSLFYVIAASHFLATLATNTSLAFTFASSTMAVKMLEPTTSAVLQALLLKRPMRAESAGGMVIVVAGSALYVGGGGGPASDQSGGTGDVLRAVVMALVSNVALGVRNVAMKRSQESSHARSSRLRPASHLSLGFAACAAVCLLYLTRFPESTEATAAAWGFGPPRAAPRFLLLTLASGVLHVTYSYVSTGVVLPCLSVVGHALANVFKRVLVVVLLHASGRRSASKRNWAGLALCFVGLLVYYRGRMASASLSSVAPASGAAHGDVKENVTDKWFTGQENNIAQPKTDVSPASTPASKRIKGTPFYRILLPLVFVFIICVMPERMMTAELSRLSQGQSFRLGLLQERDKRESYRFESLRRPIDRGKGYQFQSSLVAGETDLVSKVLDSNPKHQGKSDTDYALNLRFGYENWTDGQPLIKDPIPFQPDRKSLSQIREFLSRKSLMTTPFDTDGLSPYLTTAEEVIEEAKRVHFNLFRDLFKGKKYAVLFEFATFENKGDAALSVAEIVLLENLGIKLLFYVNLKKCYEDAVKHAMMVARKYPRDEVIVLFHGGGNIIAHSHVDRCRERSLKLSRGYQQVILANSLWMREPRDLWDFSRRLYCCNSNLTILLRDRLSLYIAQRAFRNGTRLLLAPDMAFHNGRVARYAPPYYDVIWQKRTDRENALFDEVPAFPPNVSVFVWDWLGMPSIQTNDSLRMAVNVLQNGLGILQKGRVVVTDRLHGHILSVLLDIPHVLLDNADQKLSSYHNTWTRGLRNCRLADNAEDAARLALELLEEYRDSLPPRLRAADINETELYE